MGEVPLCCARPFWGSQICVSKNRVRRPVCARRCVCYTTYLGGSNIRVKKRLSHTCVRMFANRCPRTPSHSRPGGVYVRLFAFIRPDSWIYFHVPKRLSSDHFPQYTQRVLITSHETGVYRGTSLIRKSVPLGPYSRNMPSALWRP